MSSEESPAVEEKSTGKYLPLRIWPAVILLAVLIVCRALPEVWEDAPPQLLMAGFMGPLACAGLLVVWWVTLSRSTMKERLFGLLGLLAAGGATYALVDPSMQGPGIMMLTLPLSAAVFGATAIVFSRWLSFRRTVAIVMATALVMGYSLLLRTEGMWGDYAIQYHWRWEESIESQNLAARAVASTGGIDQLDIAVIDEALANPQWPAFRGPQGDSRQYGSKVSPDWESSPPEQLWKVPIGPGWSSFVVAGPLLFTQEQRGEEEAVVCLDSETGRQLWAATYPSRFSDPLGGPGPRATPTLSDGALYAMGAEGVLSRLDPKTGDIQWQQDLREVADREPPTWGFSSSPLVVDGLVIVHAGGKGDKGTLATANCNGAPRQATIRTVRRN